MWAKNGGEVMDEHGDMPKVAAISNGEVTLV
jgi:hypothetical protein